MKFFVTIALSLVLLSACTSDKTSETPSPSPSPSPAYTEPAQTETPAPQQQQSETEPLFTIKGLPAYGKKAELEGETLSPEEAVTVLIEKIAPLDDAALPKDTDYAFMLDGTADVEGKQCYSIYFGEFITNNNAVAPLRIFAVSGQKEVFEMNVMTGAFSSADSLPEIVAIPEILNLKLGADAPKIDLIFYRGICKIYTVDDTDNKKLTQQIPYYAESVTEENADWFVKTSDLNFDGNTDLLILSFQGNSNIYYNCYLWNKETGYFDMNNELSSLSSISTDSTAKIIRSFTKISETEDFEEDYSIDENNSLVFVQSRVRSYDPETKMYSISVFELDEDGNKVLVSEQEVAGEEN